MEFNRVVGVVKSSRGPYSAMIKVLSVVKDNKTHKIEPINDKFRSLFIPDGCVFGQNILKNHPYPKINDILEFSVKENPTFIDDDGYHANYLTINVQKCGIKLFKTKNKNILKQEYIDLSSLKIEDEIIPDEEFCLEIDELYPSD